MALELIGGIASIAQLAGTVYTISKTLYEVGEALSNAPSDIKDLARDLETFADELHLLSTLLHGKDGRYADRVYRLTAKIIGDCATICTKIDRIIGKLRSGSVWAKVKWLYKEKEIMKLLARLRDLKLSLMGTLSVLSALRADHMMDSLGIQNSSLIGGQNGHGLSAGTMKQVEDTRLKLAGIKMIDTTKPCQGSTFGTTSRTSLLSKDSSSASSSSATSATFIGSSASQTNTSSLAASGFISMVAIPKSMPMLNSKAAESVDSFHSAISYQKEDSSSPVMQIAIAPTSPPQVTYRLGSTDVTKNTVTAVSSCHDSTSTSTTVTSQLGTSPNIDGKSLQSWRNEMSLLAMKHFSMNQTDAEEWAMRLPVPSTLPLTSSTPSQCPTGNQQTDSNSRLARTSSIPQELATSVYDSPIQQSIPHAVEALSGANPSTALDLTTEHSDNMTSDDIEMTSGLMPSEAEPFIGGSHKDGAKTPISPTENQADFQAAMGFAGLDVTKMGLPLASEENLELDRVTYEYESNSESAALYPLTLKIPAQPKTSLRQLPPPPPGISETVIPRKALTSNASTSPHFSTSPEYSPAEREPSKLWQNLADTRLRPLSGQKKHPDDVPVPGEETVEENTAYLDKYKGGQETATNPPPPGDRLAIPKKTPKPVIKSLGKIGSFKKSSSKSQNIPVAEKAKYNDRNDWSDIMDADERRIMITQRTRKRVKTDKRSQNLYAESCALASHSFHTSDINRLSDDDDDDDDDDKMSGLPWGSIQLSYQQQQQQQLQRMQQSQQISQQLQVRAETVAPGHMGMQSQSHSLVQSVFDRRTISFIDTEHAQEVVFADESPALRFAEQQAKRRKVVSDTGRECVECHTKSTPEWRREPSGTRELCNDCAMKRGKSLRHETCVGFAPELTHHSFEPPKPAVHEIVTSFSLDLDRNASTASNINSHPDDKTSSSSPQNNDSCKGPELWLKGLQELLSLSPIFGRNLKEYLSRENIITITEAGPNLLIANSDWSASSHKEKINASLQRLPDAGSSIQRIFEVLDIMEETIGLKVGAIAWACLLRGVEIILSSEIGLALEMRVEIASQIAQISSIIARYIVMENIYAQWKEMSLDKNYEATLINFSTQVFIYFGQLLSATAECGDEFSTKTKSYFQNIMYADEACRGFTVISSAENSPYDLKRSIEDVSDDSDNTGDSDGTMRIGENCGVQDMPSPAKRISV